MHAVAERAGAEAGMALARQRTESRATVTLVLLGLAALLGAALYAGGGSSESALAPLGAGALVLLVAATAAILAGLLPRPLVGLSGGVCLGSLALLALWSGASVAWSIAPDLSWAALNRALAYVALLCLGAVAGAAARRAPTLVAGGLGLLIAAALVWSLAAKVFPGLNEDGGRIARLRLPVGYWNALAIVLVLAIPIALWVATDRRRRASVRAAAVLYVYALVVGLLLTYSRGGILAGILALGVWVALTRERLETVVALVLALPIAIGVFAYALRLPGVVDDEQESAIRIADGHAFGLALLVGAVVVWSLAYAVQKLEQRRAGTSAPDPRLAKGARLALLAGLAVAIVLLGVRGEQVADWVERQADEFANPPTILVTQEAERLTSLSSNNRWSWWNEAWDAFREAPLEGTGAASFATVHRILREDELTVTEPHSMPLQFLSELGVLGALLACAAGVAALVGAFAAVRRIESAQRQAALALAVGVFAYVAQSLVDFDWSFVAASAPVLVATGVLFASGRKRLVTRRALGWLPLVVAIGGAGIIALGAPWLAGQRVDDAYAALGEGRTAVALAAADSARSIDPLSVDPLVARAASEIELGEVARARRTLVEAVELQPLDADTWYELGAFELRLGGKPDAAVTYLVRADELDPFGPAGPLLADARAASAGS
jgi:tetratricopeptide (TPR) repeat protein